MTLPEALAESCDTYFYEIGNRFYDGGSESRVRACSSGRAASASATRPGSTSAARRTASCRRPSGGSKTFKSDWDRAWNPGDSIQLAIGQKDLAGDAAADGALLRDARERRQLVTPYLVSDVEQPAAKGSPRVVLRRFAPQPPRSAGVDPAALAAVRDGLYAATHSANGTSSGVFGNFPVPISGKTGTAEKVVQLAGLPGRPPRGPVVVVRLGAVGLGAKLVVCAADRERRPRLERGRAGSAQGLRAVLQRRGAAG